MSEEEELLQAVKEEAQTLLRSPSSTVAPPQDGLVGRQALEVLKGLLFDPKALSDYAPLGEGGMGVVRLAKQVALDRWVAVKALRPEHRAPTDVEALLSEAWLAGGLEHPNILPVYSVSLDEQGLPLIVMKRIEGLTWATLLRDTSAMAAHAPGKAPLHEHLSILLQVCNAVHFAHSRGVVHRDLKPENVMVGAFGEVYVVDWGVATRPGRCSQLAGTPAYMAPEMLGGPLAVITPLTDVYLLGAILFDVLVGRPPHRGTKPEELIAEILRSSPALPAGVPEDLADLVRRCMSLRPEQRPKSALAVRTELEAFLEHQGSLALASEAERRAGELRALLSTPAPSATGVYGLFSACRFGFQQALAAWSQNPYARSGMDAALLAMIRFELAQGSAKAARSLALELSAPDAALDLELEAASKLEAARAHELSRLQTLERELDPFTGSLSRTVAGVVVGLIWVLYPLLGKYQGGSAQMEMLSMVPLALISAVVMAIAGLRPQVRTPLNRQLTSMVAFGMVVEALAITTYYFAGRDLGPLTMPVFSGYWFVLTGAMTVALLPSLWATSVGYLLGAIGGFMLPEHRFEFGAASNAVLCVNAVVIYRQLRRRAWPPPSLK